MRARIVFGLMLAVAVASKAAPAYPTSSYCLVINNTRNEVMSVEVDGYPGHFWIVIPNHTFALSAAENGDMSQALAGAMFSFRVYEGDERTGPRGALYDTVIANQTPSSYGTSSHTLLTPVAPDPSGYDRNVPSQCVIGGYWNALIHD